MSTAELRVAFAGTPGFAREALQHMLAAGIAVPLVLTQPDRAAGRGMKPQASLVKLLALQHGIELCEPRGLKLDGKYADDAAAAHAALERARPDVLVVAAYGLILPAWLLTLPRHGCLNIHGSLLPRWRGAAPVQRAIEAGDAHTGITLMQMDAGLDTGPVMLERSTPIHADDTGGSLHDRLAQLGAQVLADGLARLLAGAAPPARAQSSDGVTYAHKLEKSQAQLDFRRPASELERQVRAFDPWPVATASIAGEPVRVWAAQALAVAHQGQPGSVLAAERSGIDLACSPGVLRVTALQRAGGRRISVADYLNGRPELRRPA